RRRLRGRAAGGPVGDLLLLRPRRAAALAGDVERAEPARPLRGGRVAAPVPGLLRGRLPVDALQGPLPAQPSARGGRAVAGVSFLNTRMVARRPRGPAVQRDRFAASRSWRPCSC